MRVWTDYSLQWETGSADLMNQSDCELMVVFVDAKGEHHATGMVHPKLEEALRNLNDRGTFRGQAGEVAVVPTLGLQREQYILFVGWEKANPAVTNMRATAGSIGGKFHEMNIQSAIIIVPKLSANAQLASAFTEGLILSFYRRFSYASYERAFTILAKLTFIVPTEEAISNWNTGVEHGLSISNGVCYARELTNVPSNRLTPVRLAHEAERLSEQYGFKCTIYDEKLAKQHQMGGLLAVGQGSANYPRMIVLSYQGAPSSDEILGIVGKGVTFDTGGISLKKAAGMEEMISDMGGAAAVFGTMKAVGELQPQLNIVMVVPAAENMPSGSAYKPGDVITTYSGQTVEVLNTDAEGRIVLADGLTTALKHGATKLIDVATLTGAVMHALGDVTTGAFTNEDAFLQKLIHASEQAGEYVWQLPLYPEYDRLIKSDVADVKNHGGTWAGAIAGALFIRHFAEQKPWIHLDIGGTAWMWESRGFEGKGGTGVMVRTLMTFIENESQSTA